MCAVGSFEKGAIVTDGPNFRHMHAFGSMFVSAGLRVWVIITYYLLSRAPITLSSKVMQIDRTNNICMPRNHLLLVSNNFFYFFGDGNHRQLQQTLLQVRKSATHCTDVAITRLCAGHFMYVFYQLYA